MLRIRFQSLIQIPRRLCKTLLQQTGIPQIRQNIRILRAGLQCLQIVVLGVLPAMLQIGSHRQTMVGCSMRRIQQQNLTVGLLRSIQIIFFQRLLPLLHQLLNLLLLLCNQWLGLI